MKEASSRLQAMEWGEVVELAITVDQRDKIATILRVRHARVTDERRIGMERTILTVEKTG